MPLSDAKPSNLDYELLGVTPGVTPVLLKKAYREKVKLWHPDRFQHKGEKDREAAEEQFKAINEAYHNILANLNHHGNPKEGSTDGERPWNGARAHEPFKTARPEEQQKSFVRRQAEVLRWETIVAGGKRGQVLVSGLWGFLEKRKGLACLVAVLVVVFVAVNWNAMVGDSTEKDMRGIVGISTLKREKPVSRVVAEETPEDTARAAASASESTKMDYALRTRENPEGYFSIGSTQHQVLAIQGKPSRINGKTWYYNLSEITFRDGRVERYDNFDGSLRIHMVPDKSTHAEGRPFITLGSSKDEVLLTQGVPTRVLGNRWFYGFSEVRFKDGRVDSFDNFFGNLKIRMVPSATFLVKDSPASFSIGSSKDEVLAVQGTPTSIQAGIWFYGSASIQFREDRVQSVFGETAGLHFVPQENMAERE